MAAIDRRLPWRVPWHFWVGAGAAALALIYVRAPHLLHGDRLFIVVPALVLLLLVAAVLWELPPAVMLCGAIALTIFSGNWTQLGLPGFPFVPDRILLLGALLALLLRSPGAAGLPRLRLKGVHLLLLATVLYATASAVLAGTLNQRATVFALLDQVGAIPFLMLLVAPVIFGGRRERNWLLVTLVAVGAYLGPTAIFETIGPHALVFPRYIHNLDVARGIAEAVGPFAAVVPEGFACYACGVAAIIAFSQWRGHWRWIAAAVAVASLFGSFLSLERGVWIGTVAGGVAVALAARELRRWLIPAAAVCAVVVTAVLTLSSTLGGATSTRVNDQYPVWDRQNQTAAAIRMIQAKPLFGFGWNNYANTATNYFQLARSYPLTGYPSAITLQIDNSTSGQGHVTVASRGGVTGALHDSYLTYAVELGLVGASLWLLCVLWGLGGAIFGGASPELRPWRLGLLALTVCFLVIAAVDPLSQNFTELLLWTWAGVVVGGANPRVAVAPGSEGPGREPNQPRLRLPTKRWRLRIAIMAAAGAALGGVGGAILFRGSSASVARTAPTASTRPASANATTPVRGQRAAPKQRMHASARATYEHVPTLVATPRISSPPSTSRPSTSLRPGHSVVTTRQPGKTIGRSPSAGSHTYPSGGGSLAPQVGGASLAPHSSSPAQSRPTQATGASGLSRSGKPAT